MAHSDDQGLVLPPKLAPIQVVIVPIYKTEEEKANLDAFVGTLTNELKAKGISFKYDDRDTQRPGFKFAEWELKGVPLRVAIGARDMQNGTVELARRDIQTKETVSQEGLSTHIEQLLDTIQDSIHQKALTFRDSHITEVNSYDEFKEVLENKGGFISCHWDGTVETEKRVKEETKATIRCIALDAKEEEGICVFTGKPSSQRVLFAKAY